MGIVEGREGKRILIEGAVCVAQNKPWALCVLHFLNMIAAAPRPKARGMG